MRWLFRILLLFVIGVPLVIVGLVAGALDDAPALTRKVEIGPDQTERAKQLLKAHDPRKLPAGVMRSFSVSDTDLDLGLNFLLSQRGGAAKVSLAAGAAMLWLSAPVPSNPFGAYINIEAIVRETSALPEFDRLKIGKIVVPGFAADWVLRRALAYLEGTESGEAATDAIKNVRIEPALVRVEYQWREDLPARLRAAIVSDDDKARMRAYQERLAAITADPKLPKQISLARLIRPLMEHAAQRGPRDNPVAEHRALILVLAFYINGRGLEALVPDARQWPRPAARKVTLSDRTDLAQHFSISAALAAAAGTPLSNAIGVYKEIDDTRGGSGFSFVDLAADRAGTLFGERAVSSSRSARVLQERIAAGLVEPDFMPSARDLPEGLSEAEFKRRYVAIDSPRYLEETQRIEQRLTGLALYK